MSSGDRKLAAFGYALVGFVYAFATLFMAILMTGAGHGWMSGAASGCGPIILPIVGAAIPYRDQNVGIVLLSIGLSSALVADFWIIHGTKEEGFGYLHRVQSDLPVEYNLWLILWSSWQVGVVYLLPKSIFLNAGKDKKAKEK